MTFVYSCILVCVSARGRYIYYVYNESSSKFAINLAMFSWIVLADVTLLMSNSERERRICTRAKPVTPIVIKLLATHFR